MDYDRKALFLALVSKEIKVKYKSTVLGYLWSLLMPCLQSMVFYVVFSRFLRFNIEDYFLFLFTGCSVWQFFSNSLLSGANTLLSNAALVKKTCAPRWIFVAATVATEAIHLLISLPVLLGLMLLCGRLPQWNIFCTLPSGGIAILFLTFGFALIAACVNVFFRDLERILQILLQVWFYVTPVFYSISQIPEEYHWLLKLNPLYFSIELFRSSFYEPQLLWHNSFYAILTGTAVMLLGVFLFHRMQKNAAEIL